MSEMRIADVLHPRAPGFRLKPGSETLFLAPEHLTLNRVAQVPAHGRRHGVFPDLWHANAAAEWD
jgi:hypothetical protein